MASKPQALSNVGEINQAITDGFNLILGLDREIAGLIAQHVQEVKDERKEAWSNLAAKVDVSKKDLGLFYKMWQRQEDSRQFEDDDEGMAVREAHRLIFSALVSGETLDFLDVLDQAKVKVNPKADRGDVFAGDAGEDLLEEPEGDDDQDPRTSPLYTAQRGHGQAACHNGQDPDKHKYEGKAAEAFLIGYHTEEGRKAYQDGAPVSDNPYPTGSDRWASWDAGWDKGAKAEKPTGSKGRNAA